MTSIETSSTSVRLPEDDDIVIDDARRAALAFLARYSGRPLDAYRHDVRGFFQWASDTNLDVLAATRPHIELYETGWRSGVWRRSLEPSIRRAECRSAEVLHAEVPDEGALHDARPADTYRASPTDHRVGATRRRASATADRRIGHRGALALLERVNFGRDPRKHCSVIRVLSRRFSKSRGLFADRRSVRG